MLKRFSGYINCEQVFLRRVVFFLHVLFITFTINYHLTPCTYHILVEYTSSRLNVLSLCTNGLPNGCYTVKRFVEK